MGNILRAPFRHLLHCLSAVIDGNRYVSNGFPFETGRARSNRSPLDGMCKVVMCRVVCKSGSPCGDHSVGISAPRGQSFGSPKEGRGAYKFSWGSTRWLLQLMSSARFRHFESGRSHFPPSLTMISEYRQRHLHSSVSFHSSETALSTR